MFFGKNVSIEKNSTFSPQILKPFLFNLFIPPIEQG